MMPMNRHTVTDVYGDQVCVGTTWYHAERVLGRPASTFKIGDEIASIAAVSTRESTPDAQCALHPDLFRESGANATCPDRVALYADVMRTKGGWGEFPAILGYIEKITLEDVHACEELIERGAEHVWLSEMAWSRTIHPRDVGKPYIHIIDGHHRANAAKLLNDEGMVIEMPSIEARDQDNFPEREKARP